MSICGILTLYFHTESCDPNGEIPASDKEAARLLSIDMTAIQSKWNDKAEKPVKNMQALAEYVAWMKELPSRSMHVDFHLDKNFNTTNLANAYTRTILNFGGPLAGYKNISVQNEQKQRDSK